MNSCIDTSAFYAYLVPQDRGHQAVRRVIEERVKQGGSLFSSSFVLSETMGLIQARHGGVALDLFLDKVYPLVMWRWVDEPLFAKILQILHQRPSRAFTAVDASCVVCVQERVGSDCIALDEDLKRFGFEVHP